MFTNNSGLKSKDNPKPGFVNPYGQKPSTPGELMKPGFGRKPSTPGKLMKPGFRQEPPTPGKLMKPGFVNPYGQKPSTPEELAKKAKVLNDKLKLLNNEQITQIMIKEGLK